MIKRGQNSMPMGFQLAAPADKDVAKTAANDAQGSHAHARTNAALRAGGIDYQIEPDGAFDPKAFTTAALKRWRKVADRLAE